MTYISLLANYTVCEHSDCPMAATCLHQLAYTESLKIDMRLHLLNPVQCVDEKKCSFNLKERIFNERKEIYNTRA